MQTHAVAHNRGVLTFTLGALLLAAPTERAVFAQDHQPASSAAQSSPSQTSPAAPPAPVGFLSEPHVITSSIDYITSKFGDGSDAEKNGFYPELSNMITGSGWLSAGPGYKHYFSNDQILLDGSAAISWHLYKMAQGRFELPKLANNHVVVGLQAMWQDNTQVNYFGIGPDSVEADRSQYRIQTTDFVSYATLKPKEWLSIGGEYGWLMRPKIMPPTGTFSGNFPDTQAQFAADPGVSVTVQPNFTHGEAFVTADTRDHRGYPSTGGVYRAALTSYFDQSDGAFSFRQYEAEGAKFIPLADTRWVLAFRGWTLYSNVPTGHQIPFYLMPAVGGNNTLRDFLDFQFHDNNILVINGESRWALFEHLDGAVFFDAGNVAPTFGGLNLAKTSYGAGLRLHTDTTTFARADVAYGSNGWRVVVRTSDPFRLSRVRRHIAAVPFMP